MGAHVRQVGADSQLVSRGTCAASRGRLSVIISQSGHMCGKSGQTLERSVSLPGPKPPKPAAAQIGLVRCTRSSRASVRLVGPTRLNPPSKAQMAKCCKAFTLRSALNATNSCCVRCEERARRCGASWRCVSCSHFGRASAAVRFAHGALPPLLRWFLCGGEGWTNRDGRDRKGRDRPEPADRPITEARPCGSSVGPGRARSDHPDCSRPTVTPSRSITTPTVFRTTGMRNCWRRLARPTR